MTLTGTDGTTHHALKIDPIKNTSFSLSIEDKKLTILIKYLLLADVEYTFTLPENVFLDDDGTGNNEHTFAFTTAGTVTIDASWIKITDDNTNFRENKTADNGSFLFEEDIDIQFPGGLVNPNLNIFDKNLGNGAGYPARPITISGLPTGLFLRIERGVVGHLAFTLEGNAASHEKNVDNTWITITFLEDLFTLSQGHEYPSEGISLSFEIIFGSLNHWGGRSGHQAFAYDDKLWVLGGFYGGGLAYNDIWSSSDGGNNWAKKTVSGPQWSTRHGHASFVHDDKIWVLGGRSVSTDSEGATQVAELNDIWYSSDNGVTWSNVVVSGSQWSPRQEHQAFVYDNKFWVIGSKGGRDIWYSPDSGVTWSNVVVNGNYWEMIYGIQAFPYDNKLWVMGGRFSASDADSTNEIWNSSDGGVNWSQITVNGDHWSIRSEHQAFAYDDKLWVLGGLPSQLNPDIPTDQYALNDVWSSSDGGTTWSKAAVQGTSWDFRNLSQAFGYDNQLWILGGQDNNVPYNDIWNSRDGGVRWEDASPFYYY